MTFSRARRNRGRHEGRTRPRFAAHWLRRWTAALGNRRAERGRYRDRAPRRDHSSAPVENRSGRCRSQDRNPLGRTRFCPVTAAQQWRERSGVTEGPIFRPVDRHGRIAPERLSAEAVSSIIKQRVGAAGFDPSGYSGHSLRAGFATSAAQAGISSWRIRQRPAMPPMRCSHATFATASCSSTMPPGRFSEFARSPID